MKFTLNGYEIEDYEGQNRPFYLFGLAQGSKEICSPYTNKFMVLVDPGAGHTIVSGVVMNDILDVVKRETGKELPILGYTHSIGVHGDKKEIPLYCVPHLCILDEAIDKGIRLFDVIIAVSDTAVIPCLLGRTILQCCVLTLDPKFNQITFDFKKDLEKNKPTMNNGSVSVYSEIRTFGV